MRQDSTTGPHHLSPLALALVVGLAGFAADSPSSPPGATAGEAPGMSMNHAGMDMTPAAMNGMVTDFYAAHPAHGASTTAAPVDSFTAANFIFELNGGGTAGQVDTAKINQGQTILWKWVTGTHTVTNGTGAADVNAGLLFDAPLTSTALTFSYQFDTPGTYPFFCRVHEGLNMKGVVVVKSLAGVPSPGDPGRNLGFLDPPWPNPTRGTASFRFALARDGRARAIVYDLEGRRVAVPLDLDMTAGTHSASWDGLTSSGARAPAGVYVLRLEVPGASQTRLLTVER